jgi:meso-butanediol dehydrogenase / (S,S)-butanediol dehydrogenase / diacetyl reductase
MTAEFNGRSYFITGAGQGIGRALAVGLAEMGATIGMADIDEAALDAAAALMRASGFTSHCYPVDCADRSRFLQATAEYAAISGGLDGIINNASCLVYEPIENVSEETLDRMLGAGLKSAIWGSQALVANRKPGIMANIVNFSSPVAFRGYPNSAIYSAVKSATTSLTRTLAAELGPRNIRVNAIAPGSVPTPGALKYVDAAEYARRAGSIPMRRLGREQDVVDGVRFLLSDGASFVNGAVLAVDGGIIASA